MKQTFEIHTRFSFLKITPVIIILSIILTSLLLTGTTLYGQRRNPNVSSPAALGGIDTTFAPRLERAGVIEKMLPQADGKIVFTGSFDKIGNAERKNIARLNADGTLDAALNLPENIFLNSLEPLPDGKFIALATGGAIVRLNPDGSLDYSFNFARTITNPASVSFKARSDGKVFVYGKFKVKRKNSVIAENLIVLDEIGGIESGYTVGAFGSIGNVIFLPDGKTAVCGLFEVKRDGMTVGRNFAVLDEHGLIDRNFDVVFDAGSFGNSETVISVAVQPDGKLLVYGFFKTASKEGGLLRSVSKNKGIVRLNADGTFDRDFSLPFVSAAVGQAIVQPDGKIILYGGLQLTPGVNTKFISRLFPDGSLDNLFNDNMPLTAEFSFGGTSEVRLQPDGKILVRGHYRVNNSPNVEKLVRLNADGTHDSSFQTSNILGGWVLGFRNLPDGKILISGNFGKIGSRTRIGLARLNADGSTDENFRLDVVKSGVEVKTLNLQPDGKIIIAGDFTVVGGEYIYNAELANSALPSSIGVVVRLNQDGSVDNSFVPFTNVF
ncbi:MAG TPA: delta-60 repeat domain-containing protein, partial [Pyrinomonadaceae bacterium]